VYSSAYHKLSRDFSGRRLSLVLQQAHSPLMTNFWPYLRQREQEVLERKNAVMNSFLHPVFRGPSRLISERLWSSPDNEKQVTLALRFGHLFSIQYVISMILWQILVDTGLVFALRWGRMREQS
jgi:hypothetical protein